MLKYRLFISLIFLSLLLSNENRPKIGLALSGGSAKGFAHAGVIKVIDSLQIPIDYIAATSFGSIIGALYSMGYSGKDLERMGAETDWNKVLTDLPDRKELPYFKKLDSDKYQLQLGLKGYKPIAPSGLINGQRVYLGLNKWIKEYEKIDDFDEFPIPFKCIAADLITGNEVILDKGSITKAIRASCSIPSVFKPVEWGDSLLDDGGVINNLPIDVVKAMGADIIIAVDVATSPSFEIEYNVIDVVARSARINEENRKDKQLKDADIIIRPDLDKYGWFDFDNTLFRNMVNDGYKAAINNIDDLTELKESLGEVDYARKHINLLPNSIISNISIIGNENLSDSFLKRLIGIRIGDYFNTDIIDKNISQMYSLGYFKIIRYTLDEEQEGVHLIFHIKEDSMKKLNVGARWDEEEGVIGIAGVLIHNKYKPGLIIDNQTQIGTSRFNNLLNIYYPSRTLDYPVYPFIRSKYDRRIINYYIPTEISPIEYLKNTLNAGFGIGFLLKNYWVMEVEFNTELIRLSTDRANKNFEIDNEKINSINFKATLDLIDNTLLPNKGGIINLAYNYSNQSIYSQRDYFFYKIDSDFYFTYKPHTIRLFMYAHQSEEFSPLYQKIFNKTSNYLVGFSTNQLYGSSISLIRFEYRYEYKTDVHFHFIVNNIFDVTIDNNSNYRNIPSFGLGTILTSRVGNIEIILGYRPPKISDLNSYEYNIKVNAGYKF